MPKATKSKVKKTTYGSKIAESKETQNFEEKQLDLKHFDTVTDYSDHHYFKNKVDDHQDNHNSACFTNPTSSVHKKIMKEWKIIEESLPDSIYVRVYENKINLLRAVIIGAAGTPYHDGLFFFDLAFPHNYPQSPPLVNFHSHGMRINPNLYATGYVCLSLLNTWTGYGNELWEPEKSTILQVLLSIQALVLNEEPYFNEPGYSGQKKNPSFRQSSLDYNDNAFRDSCHLMKYLMNNAPKNFEGFVTNYFRRQVHVILAAYNAYKDGEVKVGQFHEGVGGGHGVSSSSLAVKVSTKFKKSMDVLYPRLVDAFTKIGAFDQEDINGLKMAKSNNHKRKVVVPEREIRRSTRLKMKK